MPAVPLLLVDGSGLAWRAACGFPRRVRSRSGADITAVFGFFALLRKAHRELVPGAEILVCFDSDRAVNPRLATFPDYKARKGYPPEFTPFHWLPTIYAGLDLLSVGWSEAETWEADDDIATVATVSGRRTVVMSADHDFIQLIDRRVRLLTPYRAYRVGDVVDRFGVHPRQWCDYRALTGDASDNIPGVRGVGPKRAVHVLAGGRTLDRPRIPRTWWGERLTIELDAALQWRNLIRLRRSQPFRLEPLDRPTRELPRAADLCEALGLWR